uniref:Tafazzin family protein n=1 Tax=Panagrolaimus sp. ES5 TaxID=591445 RepID=A0AC34GP30_9BILA
MQFKASKRLRNPNEENLNVNEKTNTAGVQQNEAKTVKILHSQQSDHSEIGHRQSKTKANVDGFRYPWPFPRNPSKWHIWKSRATMTFVYFCAKTMFAGGNKLVVNNRDTFLKLFEDKSRSLLTISNHRCTIDDPLMWALIPISKFFKNIDRFRYTPAAHNICFTKASHTYWFSLGRCVPIVRGSGVFQECVDFCIEKLNDKKWIHLFPEGKVTPNPIRIKWGVGRMINETEEPPIVLPIWVNGMSKVWASAPPYYPKFGNTVEVTVGEPLDMKTYLLSLQSNVEIERRKKITDKIQDTLFELGGCKDLVKH